MNIASTATAFRLAPPSIEIRITTERDPDTQRIADQLLGTLSLEADVGSVPVGSVLHFTPAWDPAEEASASERFLDLTPEEARNQANMQVLAAGLRRLSCGVTWTVERLTVRAYNASGELLGCRSVSGIASDQGDEQRACLLWELQREVHQDALDWAVLGLN